MIVNFVVTKNVAFGSVTISLKPGTAGPPKRRPIFSRRFKSATMQSVVYNLAFKNNMPSLQKQVKIIKTYLINATFFKALAVKKKRVRGLRL